MFPAYAFTHIRNFPNDFPVQKEAQGENHTVGCIAKSMASP